MLRNKYFWICTFGGIILLMWAYLFFFPLKGTTLLGFPSWIIGFLILSAVYSTAFYLFSIYFWTEEEDKSAVE